MKTELIKFNQHIFSISIDPNMPDFSKDPTVLKRAEEAKEYLKKHPLPKHLSKK